MTTSYHIGLNAHLLSGQAGYRRAGIHGYIANTLRCLPAADPNLRYTIFVGPGMPPESPQFTVQRTSLPTDKAPVRILWEQALQPWQLGGIDLQHGMTFVTPELSRKPSVVTVYDLSFHHYPERLSTARRLYLRTFTARSVHRAHRVIAISESTADDLVRLLGVPRDKIDVAVPGVHEQYRPLPAEDIAAFRQKHDLPERYILHLGTLEPRKNLAMMLRAYDNLPASIRQDVPLILVGGKGWGLDEIRAEIVRLGLEEHVRFEGYAPDDELPLWYNAAAALVYPSVFEGWGMPIVEALACGTPVVASNASSLPEAAGDAGLLLNPHSVDDWTAGLQQALDDSTWRADAIKKGLTHAAALSWQQTAAVHVASYRRSLA